MLYPFILYLRREWTSSENRLFPAFVAYRENLTVSIDGPVCFSGRILVPLMMRSIIIKNSYFGHVGIDKIKWMERMMCRRPGLNKNIVRSVGGSKKGFGKQH